LEQINYGALLIQQAVLVLTQTVDPLVVVGLELHLDLEKVTPYGLELPRRRPGEIRRRHGQEFGAGGAIEDADCRFQVCQVRKDAFHF
jgi:hypothetical protein